MSAAADAFTRHLPWIVLLNLLVVSSALLAAGRLVTRRPLKELPDGLQNAAELALEWFVDQARRIDPRSVPIIAPFLASLFLVILLSNLLAVLPIPVLGLPPTSYYAVPLALSVVAVLGSLVIGAKVGGVTAGLRHLFWPNPLQLVSELSHTLSLSLRLYGNIGGELIVASLVAQSTPYGIPLLVHALGLIPAAVQPFVFTLLTANFVATALHGRARRQAAAGAPHLNVSSAHGEAILR